MFRKVERKSGRRVISESTEERLSWEGVVKAKSDENQRFQGTWPLRSQSIGSKSLIVSLLLASQHCIGGGGFFPEGNPRQCGDFSSFGLE